MGEIAHIFGQDLQLSGTGDLLIVTGPTETQQRLYRRLMTNMGAYIWELTYGAGLPSRVGEQANAADLAAVIRSQIYQEATVSQSPPPVISVQVQSSGVVICSITYTDNSTNLPVTLTFSVSPPPILAGST